MLSLLNPSFLWSETSIIAITATEISVHRGENYETAFQNAKER